MSSSTKYCPASIDSDKILACTKVTGLILSRNYIILENIVGACDRCSSEEHSDAYNHPLHA